MRSTKQRQVILEGLQSVYNHPTATEIYKMAKGRMPGIGLATVYRTLEYLGKKGLILKLKSVNEEARYDGHIDGHAHLICEKCGDVTDIHDLKKIKFSSRELKNSGFQVSSDRIEIPGVCKKCL